jgi:uncharacterized membrane protein YqjE
VCAHLGAGARAVIVAAIIAITRLVVYTVDDDKRWRRFLFLVFLALAVAADWWLLADDGIQVLLHQFR